MEHNQDKDCVDQYGSRVFFEDDPSVEPNPNAIRQEKLERERKRNAHLQSKGFVHTAIYDARSAICRDCANRKAGICLMTAKPWIHMCKMAASECPEGYWPSMTLPKLPPDMPADPTSGAAANSGNTSTGPGNGTTGASSGTPATGPGHISNANQ